jgi:RNA 3'-terminal phosphate cyclase (ATP)
LLGVSGNSRIELEGGTHNPWAPPFDFLQRVYAPLLEQAGAGLRLRLERHGFFPAGGGRAVAQIRPATTWQPLSLTRRGPVRRIRVEAVVARLPRRIAEEEAAVVAEQLAGYDVETVMREVDSAGPGNAAMAEIDCREITELFTAFGRKGLPASTVGGRLAGAVMDYLQADVPVGPWLADQLLLPLALGGGGEFVTHAPTAHTRTNMAVIERFLEVAFQVEHLAPGRCLITCRRRTA